MRRSIGNNATRTSRSWPEASLMRNRRRDVLQPDQMCVRSHRAPDRPQQELRYGTTHISAWLVQLSAASLALVVLHQESQQPQQHVLWGSRTQKLHRGDLWLSWLRGGTSTERFCGHNGQFQQPPLQTSNQRQFSMPVTGEKTGLSHYTKMVPVKSHNDFSRPLAEKRVV